MDEFYQCDFKSRKPDRTEYILLIEDSVYSSPPYPCGTCFKTSVDA